jgi:hypothetical protein
LQKLNQRTSRIDCRFAWEAADRRKMGRGGHGGGHGGPYSPLRCFGNIFIAFIGAGILGMPYAFSMVSADVPVCLLVRAFGHKGIPYVPAWLQPFVDPYDDVHVRAANWWQWMGCTCMESLRDRKLRSTVCVEVS